MAVYAGRKGLMYLSTTGGGTAVSVIKISEWTLDMSTDMIEVTAFQDANKTYVQGLKDIKFTYKGFWDDTETKPFVAADSSTAVSVYLYPSSDAPAKYWYGTAWMNVSISNPVNGATAISGSGAAAGTWTRV